MPLAAGSHAPAFRLLGVDNHYWILGDPDRRRSVLLAFAGRESGSSRHLLRNLERVFRRPRSRDAEILGIVLDSHRDTLELAEDYAITFPLLIEEAGEPTFRAYEVDRIPTLFRLDGKLRVVESLVGWRKDRFEAIAQAYLEAVGAPDGDRGDRGDLAPEESQADPVVRRRGRGMDP